MRNSPEILEDLGFKAQTYDVFNEETGQWSFKDCDASVAYIATHIKTGKQYKINQVARIVRYGMANK